MIINAYDVNFSFGYIDGRGRKGSKLNNDAPRFEHRIFIPLW